MTNSQAIAKLKTAMLAAQTLGELYALMEDYSYMEFMQIYNQMTQEQQARIDEICDRDNQMQLAATFIAKAPAPTLGTPLLLKTQDLLPAKLASPDITMDTSQVVKSFSRAYFVNYPERR